MIIYGTSTIPAGMVPVLVPYQGMVPSWVVKYIEILYVYQGGCLNPQRMVVNAYKRGLSHGHENQN